MKAVGLKAFGGYEQLEYREDVPSPSPGPGEVLIRVGAAGVNTADINTRAGWRANQATSQTQATGFAQARVEHGGWNGKTPRFPRIQGADARGRIAEVDEGVAPSRIGERVIVEAQMALASKRVTGKIVLTINGMGELQFG